MAKYRYIRCTSCGQIGFYLQLVDLEPKEVWTTCFTCGHIAEKLIVDTSGKSKSREQ